MSVATPQIVYLHTFPGRQQVETQYSVTCWSHQCDEQNSTCLFPDHRIPPVLKILQKQASKQHNKLKITCTSNCLRSRAAIVTILGLSQTARLTLGSTLNTPHETLSTSAGANEATRLAIQTLPQFQSNVNLCY